MIGYAESKFASLCAVLLISALLVSAALPVRKKPPSIPSIWTPPQSFNRFRDRRRKNPQDAQILRPVQKCGRPLHQRHRPKRTEKMRNYL